MAGRETKISNHSGWGLGGAVVDPVGPMRAVAIFAHRFNCTRANRVAARITGELARLGIATLRLDLTGLGASDGGSGSDNLSNDVAKLLAAAQQLAATLGPPQLLVGHGPAGAVVLIAAGRIRTLRAVATIDAPSDHTNVLEPIQGKIPEIGAPSRDAACMDCRRIPWSAALSQSARQADVLVAVGQLHCPLLIAHSPNDAVVGIDHARRLFDAAGHPKLFLSLDDSGYLMNEDADRWYAARVIACWADRYLEEATSNEQG